MSSAVPVRSRLPISQLFAGAEAALSFVGAGIAGTLWWADRTKQDVPCSPDGGCEIVAGSAWSHVDLIILHHVPVALLGLVGYVFLLSLAMIRLGSDSPHLDYRLHQLIWLVSAGGMAYSWYLQWVAHAEIGAFCIWCRTSACVMTVLFLTATWEFWMSRRGRDARQETLHG